VTLSARATGRAGWECCASLYWADLHTPAVCRSAQFGAECDASLYWADLHAPAVCNSAQFGAERDAAPRNDRKRALNNAGRGSRQNPSARYPVRKARG